MILLVAATDRELCGRDGLVCGVGPVEAAAATARSLASGAHDAVLHVGLAGAAGLPLGSLVVGSESLYADIAARWPVVERIVPDPALVDAALSALPDAASLPIHTSAAVGGASNAAAQAPCVEAMEGFGVLRAAALAGVPALEVRAISNELGEEDRSRWVVPAALEQLRVVLPSLVDALEAVQGDERRA